MPETSSILDSVSLHLTELAFCSNASSFLQSDFWGSFKARFGWKTHSFAVEWKEANTVLPLLVLYRRLGMGIGFAYVPWGPELPTAYDEKTSQNASA